MNVPQPRKPIRLAAVNYRGFQRYFVTLCCFGRKKHLARQAVTAFVLELLRSESVLRGFAILAYCAMPDHLHFLAEGREPGSNFLQFLKSFKIKSSRRFSKTVGGALWQRGYYEHILREAEAVEPVAWYIWLNPVRKGLAARPDEYQWNGSFAGMAIPAAWSAAAWRPPGKHVGCEG